jgi:hypothetical protein
MAHLKEKLNYVLKNPDRVIARKLASIIGQIIFISFVLGNVCQIMTRHLHLPIIDSTCWDGYIVLDQKYIDELKLWFSNCDILPFRVISLIHKSVERILFTDASNYATAGVLLQSKNEVVHVMFDENEIKQSSTFRELKAVEFVLRTLHSHLSGRFVKLSSDNQNVVLIVNIGSMKRELQNITFSIFEQWLSFNIVLDVAWVPRLLSTEADFYSKIFDYDDWEINQLVFNYLDQIWGPFSFHRFADNKNYKVAEFNSQFLTGIEGVDAFAYDWSNDNNWLVPPIHYIPNVINHMLKYRCYGIFVVPKWKSALFWPCIVKNSGEFEWFVKDKIEYVYPRNFFKAGSHKESVFARSSFISNVLVLKIDCRNIIL